MKTPDLELRLPRQRCGIYHLIRDWRVVYVGQSMNLMMRMGGHDYTQYDSVRFYYCDPTELKQRELADIQRLQPELNAEGITKPYRLPNQPKQVYEIERARLATWMEKFTSRTDAA